MTTEDWRTNAAKTGLVGTEAQFLDLHFEACRPEYEAMLRSVGIQSGWRVLDAGCGGGGFVPLLAELVGPAGHITAFDLAPDSLAQVEARVRQENLQCPVATQVGNLTRLPFADSVFDAVWTANALMYLTDAELLAALAEFRRVVRPGGLVAIKDVDLGFSILAPADFGLIGRFCDHARQVVTVIHG